MYTDKRFEQAKSYLEQRGLRHRLAPPMRLTDDGWNKVKGWLKKGYAHVTADGNVVPTTRGRRRKVNFNIPIFAPVPVHDPGADEWPIGPRHGYRHI